MPFSPKTLNFLAENRMRNDREWFHAHKKEYETYVLAPFLELAEKLGPVMKEIDPLLNVHPKKCISRVYRDTRFSKDKSLYRDVMWCSYTRDKEECTCPPGFYLELSPNGIAYGCGYYKAPAAIMQALRELVLQNDEAFLKADKVLCSQNIFQLEGELYKRPHFKGHPEEKRNWLERRNIDVNVDSADFALLYSNHLSQVLADAFQTLKPVYYFILKAEEKARIAK